MVNTISYIRHLRIGSIDGIVKNAKRSMDLDKLGTYHGIVIKCLTSAGANLTVAQMQTDVKLIRIKLNGDVIQELSGTEALMLQQAYGAKDDVVNKAGIIYLPFYPRNIKNDATRAKLALGMKGVNNFQIEVQAGNPTTLNLSTVEISCLRTEQENPIGAVYTIKPLNQSYNTTGIDTVENLPRAEENAGIFAMHFEEANSSSITNIDLKDGAKDLLEGLDTNLHEVLNLDSGITPQSGYRTLYFGDVANGFLSTSLKGLKAYVTFETNAPNDYNCLLEKFENLQA